MGAVPDHGEERVARRVLAELRRDAAFDEGVGVLRCWGACSARQVRRDLDSAHGPAGQEAEAARVVALVDADALSRSDPDWN